MKILSTIFGIAALASTSFAQFAPQFEYSCQDPDNYYSLKLYGYYSPNLQQPGVNVITFRAQRLENSPPSVVYPNGVVLFGSPIQTAPTPFGHETLCIPRTSSIFGWIRDEESFTMPVYNAAFPQGSLSDGMYFQAWSRNIGPNGIVSEITNMVGVTW